MHPLLRRGLVSKFPAFYLPDLLAIVPDQNPFLVLVLRSLHSVVNRRYAKARGFRHRVTSSGIPALRARLRPLTRWSPGGHGALPPRVTFLPGALADHVTVR